MSYQPQVRVTLAPLGRACKVEVFAAGAWHDISKAVASATVEATAVEATTVTLELAHVTGTADGLLDDATLRVMQRLVKEATADGRLK